MAKKSLYITTEQNPIMPLGVSAARLSSNQKGNGRRIDEATLFVVVGAATNLIIDGGCANPQSPHFKR